MSRENTDTTDVSVERSRRRLILSSLIHDRTLWPMLAGSLVVCLSFAVLPLETLAHTSRYYNDLIFLSALIIALVSGLTRIRHVEEHRFWTLLTTAFGFWSCAALVGLVLGVFGHEGNQFWAYPVIDLSHFLMYGSALLAVVSNPHLRSGWSRHNVLYHIESVGVTVLAVGILFYFVVSERIMLGAAWSPRPPLAMFSLLDILLACAIYVNRRAARSPRWKLIYSILLTVALIWAATDLLEALVIEGIVIVRDFGTPLDLLWAIGFPLVAIAARLRVVPFGEMEHPDLKEGEALQRLRRSSLVASALALPFIHFVLSASGFLDPATRVAREWCVVAFMILLGGVAIVHQGLLEKARRKAQSGFRELFDDAPVMYVVVRNQNGSLPIDDCNDLFLTTLQLQRSEVVGLDFNRFYEGQTFNLEKNEPNLQLITECRLTGKEGAPIPAIGRARIITDSNGEPVGARAAFVDISERRQLEEMLRQSQKMEAVGLLAGGIAHDFNNFLTVIQGYCELLLQKLGNDEQTRHEVSQIHQTSLRATSLTQQLLAFSRRQVLRPQLLDLNKLLTGTHDILSRLVREDVKLSFQLGEALGLVKADPGQLEQVILNLVINARDAMPLGGRLTIKTINSSSGGRSTDWPSDVEPGEYILLSIIDTGTGMDEPTLAQAFEPFFTTKGQGKGTGLGLSTVYGIVKQSGGFVWATSRPSEGTTFHVLLPEVAAMEPFESTLNEPIDSENRIDGVMVVEDDPEVRGMIVRYLRRRKFEVIECCDGEEALDSFTRRFDDIDLVLTDMVMPGRSGRQLAAELLALKPGLRVLFMSGHTDDQLDDGFLARNPLFLKKPFSMDELDGRIRCATETTT